MKLIVRAIFWMCMFSSIGHALGESAKEREKFLETMGQYLTAVDMNERIQKSRCAYAYRKRIFSLNSALEEVMPMLELSEKRELMDMISSGKLDENQGILDGYFESAARDGLDDKTACGLVVGAFTGLNQQAIENWIYLVAERNFAEQRRSLSSSNVKTKQSKSGFVWFEGNEITRTGKGKLKWPNGDVYEGDFVNGDRTGKGKYTWSNGDVYEGDFVKGDRTGKGNFTYTDGDVYEGDYVNGDQTGKGKYTFTSGDVYEGDYVNGDWTGKGKYTWASGNVYDGDWRDGERSGKGKYTWTDGSVYEGDFQNGIQTGWGKRTTADGMVYVGEFISGKPSGQGSLLDGVELIYQGDWYDGKPVNLKEYLDKEACKPFTELLVMFDAQSKRRFDPKAIGKNRKQAMMLGTANAGFGQNPLTAGATAGKKFDAKLRRAMNERQNQRLELVKKMKEAGC